MTLLNRCPRMDRWTRRHGMKLLNNLNRFRNRFNLFNRWSRPLVKNCINSIRRISREAIVTNISPVNVNDCKRKKISRRERSSSVWLVLDTKWFFIREWISSNATMAIEGRPKRFERNFNVFTTICKRKQRWRSRRSMLFDSNSIDTSPIFDPSKPKVSFSIVWSKKVKVRWSILRRIERSSSSSKLECCSVCWTPLIRR